MKSSSLAVAALLVVLSGADTVLGQTTSAQISGTVPDPSGAIVIGAAVALQHEETSEARTTATNAGIGNRSRFPLAPR
jgi:hypothetical protein